MPDAQRLLELALKGLEAERHELDNEIAQIKAQLLNRSETAARRAVGTIEGLPKRRRTMSAEARRRISEGMKRRYAQLRKASKK